MTVKVSEPYDPVTRVEYRLCICGTMPRPTPGGVTGNMRLVGRETPMPDLSRYRLKAGRWRPKTKPRVAVDQDNDGIVETVSFKSIHGIR